jgi:hypothetical protein
MHVQEKVPRDRDELLANVEIVPDKKDDFVSESHKDENEMERPVARCSGNTTKYHKQGNSDRIFGPQRSQIVTSFDPGIDHIQKLGQRHEPKEPDAAREEVILVPVIFSQIVGKQQHAQKKHGCVEADEEIDSKIPLDPAEAEFPPPEREDIQKRPCDPSEVDQRAALAARVRKRIGQRHRPDAQR